MLDSFKTQTVGGDAVVAFRVKDQDYCIDIGHVREIRGWTPTTLLPHAPHHVKGVINLRGAVVAVIDLAARLSLGETAEDGRNVILIVEWGGRIVGLLAEVVSDIVPMADHAIQPVPDVADDCARTVIAGVITFEDGRILRKIDLSRLLPESIPAP